MNVQNGKSRYGRKRKIVDYKSILSGVNIYASEEEISESQLKKKQPSFKQNVLKEIDPSGIKTKRQRLGQAFIKANSNTAKKKLIPMKTRQQKMKMSVIDMALGLKAADCCNEPNYDFIDEQLRRMSLESIAPDLSDFEKLKIDDVIDPANFRPLQLNTNFKFKGNNSTLIVSKANGSVIDDVLVID